MFAARSWTTRAARRTLRAFSSAARSSQTQRCSHSRLLAAAAGAAAIAGSGLALALSQNSSSSLPPVSTPHTPDVSQQSAAASGHPGAEEVHYYKPTYSSLSKLPQTAEELAATSYEDLRKLLDPAEADSVLHPVAHALLRGGPPPEHGAEPLELLWTAADPDPFHRHLELVVRSAQNRICNALLDAEQLSAATIDQIDGRPLSPTERTLLLAQSSDAPGRIRETVVIRPDGSGGGIERVLSTGRVFSKAGVNVSVSAVPLPAERFASFVPDHPSLLKVQAPKAGEVSKLWTASISLVLHPVSPHVPTSHANYRYFQLDLPNGQRAWWFGGGADLTPTYVVDDDAKFFHGALKHTLDQLDKAHYPKWKKWCDEYFFIPHRGETRGVGGVFFDDQCDRPREHHAAVMERMAEAFASQYFPIVLKRKDEAFDEQELAFQQLRRGRYTEFNLVYDKGTQYGLRMPRARIDAILMSLPAIARFQYKQQFTGERELRTKDILSNPRDW